MLPTFYGKSARSLDLHGDHLSWVVRVGWTYTNHDDSDDDDGDDDDCDGDNVDGGGGNGDCDNDVVKIDIVNRWTSNFPGEKRL